MNTFKQKTIMDTPMLTELREHLKNTPLSQLRKEWDKIEAKGISGPNAFEYLDFLDNIQWEYHFKPVREKHITKNITPEYSGLCFLIPLRYETETRIFQA